MLWYFVKHRDTFTFHLLPFTLFLAKREEKIENRVQRRVWTYDYT